jgi:hypothetical protein
MHNLGHRFNVFENPDTAKTCSHDAFFDLNMPVWRMH